MKRFKSISILFASALVGATMFVSCGGNDGPSIEYTLSQSEVVLTSEKGASTSFGITFTEESGQWVVTQVPEFVTVYPQSGSGAGTVRVTAVDNNNSKQPYEGVITVEVDGAKVKTQTIRVVQQNLTDCYAEPSNVLQMSDGLAFNWEIGRNTKYYYWGCYEQSVYNKMSESEVLKNIVTGNVSDRVLPDNDGFACTYDLDANTQYVVITVSFAEGDRQGDLVVTPITTKPTSNQPEATINDVSYYTDNSNNYYYGWNIKKNTYCSQYYTYAAASPDNFWAYYRLAEGTGVLVAWALRTEIQKDGQDHTTSINNGYSWLPFNNGRDQFYAAQVESGVTSDFRAFPNTDKYLLILTWGTNASGELSGVMNYEGYNFTSSSSSARKGEMLKANSHHKSSGTPKILNLNTQDFKFTRLK